MTTQTGQGASATRRLYARPGAVGRFLSNLRARVTALIGARRLLRLEAFDSSTFQGRADERHRKALLSAGTAMLAKVSSTVAALITIPITLDYLGTERFGVWMTITSFVMLLSFTDLGIGNGMMTAIAQASGRGDRGALRSLVTSGLSAATLISFCLIALILSTYTHVPWADLLNVHDPLAAREVAPAIFVLILCFALSMPSSIANRVQMGLQQGFAASLVQIVGAALGLAATLLAVKIRASLPVLVLAYVGSPVLVQILNSVHFFGARRTDLRPSIACLSRDSFRRLFRLGFLFFVLQLALAIGSWSDNLVVSRFLSPSAVAEYSVPAKLYALITTAIMMFLSPLWPAYGEAMARGDHLWVRRTLIRTMLLSTILATAAVGFLSMLMHSILMVWVEGRVNPSLLVMAGLSAVTVFEVWRASLVMFLNGTGSLRLSAFVEASFALVCLPLRIWLVQRIGLAGIPVGALLAYLTINLTPLLLHLRMRLRTDLAST